MKAERHSESTIQINQSSSHQLSKASCKEFEFSHWLFVEFISCMCCERQDLHHRCQNVRVCSFIKSKLSPHSAHLCTHTHAYLEASGDEEQHVGLLHFRAFGCAAPSPVTALIHPLHCRLHDCKEHIKVVIGHQRDWRAIDGALDPVCLLSER
jgi:hypothetical protein